VCFNPIRKQYEQGKVLQVPAEQKMGTMGNEKKECSIVTVQYYGAPMQHVDFQEGQKELRTHIGTQKESSVQTSIQFIHCPVALT
jgi:hypothetical protein